MTTTQAPDALRLVPVQPTPEMLAKGKYAYAMTHEDDALRGAWAVMLAAAPAVQPAAGREDIADIIRDHVSGPEYRGDEIDEAHRKDQLHAVERILAAISTPAQASETGGEMLGRITQALVRADEEFGNSLSAYRYRKLAEGVAALSAPQAAPEPAGPL